MDKQSFIKSVKNWQSEVVEQALAANPALANFADQSGKRPLHHCCETNGAKLTLDINQSIQTAAALIAAGADVNAVRIIIDEGEEFQATPLWYAVAWGKNFALASYLLKEGSDPNQCMWAALWDQDLKLAELLRSYGAEIDPVYHDETPLLQIVRAKRFLPLQWLKEQGANFNFQDSKGYTPLHYAVKAKQTLAQIGELLKHGADPTITAKDGTTAISLAREQGKAKLVELLENCSS